VHLFSTVVLVGIGQNWGSRPDPSRPIGSRHCLQPLCNRHFLEVINIHVLSLTHDRAPWCVRCETHPYNALYLSLSKRPPVTATKECVATIVRSFLRVSTSTFHRIETVLHRGLWRERRASTPIFNAPGRHSYNACTAALASGPTTTTVWAPDESRAVHTRVDVPALVSTADRRRPLGLRYTVDPPDAPACMAARHPPCPEPAAAAAARPEAGNPLAAFPTHPVAAALCASGISRQWLLPAATPGRGERGDVEAARAVVASLPAGWTRDGLAQAVGFTTTLTGMDGRVLKSFHAMVGDARRLWRGGRVTFSWAAPLRETRASRQPADLSSSTCS